MTFSVDKVRADFPVLSREVTFAAGLSRQRRQCAETGPGD